MITLLIYSGPHDPRVFHNNHPFIPFPIFLVACVRGPRLAVPAVPVRHAATACGEVVRGSSPSQHSAAAPDTCYCSHLLSPASKPLQLPPGEPSTCGAEQLHCSRHLLQGSDVGELYPKQFASLLESRAWWHYNLHTTHGPHTWLPAVPRPPRPTPPSPPPQTWFPVAVTGVTGLAAAASCCLHSQF